MKTNETNGVSVKDSIGHTADNKSAIDIDFLKLTTDICYMIGGFFGGKLPDCESYIFMNDLKQVIWLNMNEKLILADKRLSKVQMYALASIAFDNDFCIDILDEEESEN